MTTRDALVRALLAAALVGCSSPAPAPPPTAPARAEAAPVRSAASPPAPTDADEVEAKAEVEAFDAAQDEPDFPKAAVPPVLRGSPERRAAMAEARKGAEQNVANARKTLDRRRAARRAQVEAEAARALESVKRGPLRHAGATLGLRAYDEAGFTVVADGRELRHGWSSGPAELCHDVRLRAIDPGDPQALLELGRYACRRLLFADARRHVARALELRPELQPWAPDLDALEGLARLFRGQVTREDARTRAAWSFDEPAELQDVEPYAEGMRRGLVGGQLEVGTDAFRLSLARLRGAWSGRATLSVTLGSTRPPPLVGLAGRSALLAVELGRTTRLVDVAGLAAPPLAEAQLLAAHGDRVVVEVTLARGELALRVTVGGRPAFTHTAPWDDDEVTFALGGLGRGEARFDDLVVEGRLAPRWERRTSAGAAGEVARALDAQVEPDERGQRRSVPYAFATTSAEDPVALEGIDPRWVDLLGEGRQHLEAGELDRALECFRQAADRAPDLHAAAYLVGVEQAAREPDRALARLDRAIAGVEDFHEARVARAVALTALGRLDEAGVEVERALALRPDFSPAHAARARLQLLRGEHADALATLELADLLGPGDPYTRQALSTARALVEGPPWPDRTTVTTASFRLETDRVAEADRLARRLDGIAARYAELLPSLARPGAPARPAPVLLFSELEDYQAYAERLSGLRATDTLGHFDAATGQLLVAVDPDDPGALHVLHHEGLHQWLHRQGVSLPLWAAEGLAEYVGGTELGPDGAIVARGVVDSYLVARLRGARDWSRDRLRFSEIMCQSPQELHAGDVSFKYAQAWAMAHFFLESGERAAVEGVERSLRDLFVEYLERFRTPGPAAQAGSRLEYAYVETFHRLDDVAAVERRFDEYVVALARRSGVELR